MPGKSLLQPRSSQKTRLLALAEWTFLGALVGVVCGSASALFLALLGLATDLRESQSLLIYALPLAGLALGAFYERYGKSIRTGTDLVIDTIEDDGPAVPLRMAPMVLVGTVLTHLFGGSAGREGTAVQMGASLADALAQRLHMHVAVRRDLLAAGVAGGFGSVFGTPLAGAVFGLEFVVAGRIEYRALVPVLVAALVGDLTTRAWGVGHTLYPIAPHLDLSVMVLLKWALFALVVALVAATFIELTHFLKRQGRRYFPALAVRMFAGGLMVVVLWRVIGSTDYLGLSVPLILRSFSDPTLPTYAFALKLLLTAITLGAGFLGGEVTPLFCIGATLGNVLASALGLPLELGAGVGMAAMFASASNTPLALSVMAVELLGTNAFPHVAIVCVLAYVLSGHRSIYHAQRLAHEKGGRTLSPPIALRDIRRQNERAVRDALRAARAESAAARERVARGRNRAAHPTVPTTDVVPQTADVTAVQSTTLAEAARPHATFATYEGAPEEGLVDLSHAEDDEDGDEPIVSLVVPSEKRTSEPSGSATETYDSALAPGAPALEQTNEAATAVDQTEAVTADATTDEIRTADASLDQTEAATVDDAGSLDDASPADVADIDSKQPPARSGQGRRKKRKDR